MSPCCRQKSGRGFFIRTLHSARPPAHAQEFHLGFQFASRVLRPLGLFLVALLHACDERVDVVAHEVELVNVVLTRRMHRNFSGRQTEDQPALVRVDIGKFQDVAQKSAIGFGVCTVNDRVSANNHKLQTTSRSMAESRPPFSQEPALFRDRSSPEESRQERRARTAVVRRA